MTPAEGRRSTPSPTGPASPSRPSRGCSRGPRWCPRTPSARCSTPSTALDYLPSGAARSLAVRHHDTYGLVLPELTGPYYAELLVGFETRAAELDQSVMLVLAGTKEDRDRAVRTPRHPGRRHRGARLGRRPRRQQTASRSSSSPATPAPASRRSPPRTSRAPALLTEHLFDHGRTQPASSSVTPTPPPTSSSATRASSPPTAARGLTPADPVRAEFRERDGTAVAERLLAGELHRRRPGLRQRRARPGRDGPAHRRRRRRARGHRHRRLGRRHDVPLRAARPDHRPPAGAASSGRWPPTGSTTWSPEPPRAPSAGSWPPRW